MSEAKFLSQKNRQANLALGDFSSVEIQASASAFTYKFRSADLRQVGLELGVRYALTGSVRKERHRVRITVQLADASSGEHLWADHFEDELDGIFAMQDSVASLVSSTIAPALRRVEIERARRKPTESLTAYDLFLRALPLYRSNAEHNEEALNLLQRAIRLDPAYSSAYGLAAVSYFWKKVNAWALPSDPKLADGIRFAHSAVETGANHSEALWMGAQALAWLAGDFEAARDLTAKSLALNTNSSQAWAVRAMTHGHLGDLETSLDHLERARRLSPLEFPFESYWGAFAHSYFVAGNFVEVIRYADRALAEQPDSLTAMRPKIAACGKLGHLEEGRACVERLLALAPATTVSSLRTHYEPVLRHKPGLIDDFVAGLRRSGLPER
jgi:tetratricopeptide (TPR) repeat protein